MITLLLLASVTHIQYSFPMDQPTVYELNVKFDGYIPVLGGQQGKVDVSLSLEAAGKAPDADGNSQVRSEIKDLKMVFNGALLPLGVQSIKTFFPPTVVSLSPEGKVLKSDAPNLKLPVQLPGLDVKRFPDISYVPIEFPKDGIEVGKSFTYTKSFGVSQVAYTVTPIEIDDTKVEMSVELVQDYDGLEDSRHNAVAEDKDPALKIKTHVTGKGSATFDRKSRRVTVLHIEADAKGHVVELATQKESDRDLQTTLDVKLKQPA